MSAHIVLINMKAYSLVFCLFLFLITNDVAAQNTVSITTSGNPGGAFNVTIRGVGSTQVTTTASLLVINGAVASPTTSIESLEVSSVEVLDSQESLALYGVTSVVVLTTLDDVEVF